MAKRQIKFITVPLSLWEHPDLTLHEKRVLIDIDSICTKSDGVAIGVQALASICGFSTKEVKEVLSELHQKGALEVSINTEGQKTFKPLLYKERYVKAEQTITIGDKPTDVETIDYEYIREQWNLINPRLSQLQRMTPKRKRTIRTTLKGCGVGVPELIKAFKIIGTVPFLCGKNDSSWAADADWAFGKAQTLTRILEGAYSKNYAEQQAYQAIMRGEDISDSEKDNDDYYR